MALDEKVRISLNQLQRKLNIEMHCPAGINQVYVISRMKTNGRVKREAPQICLDCKIRSYLGWRKKVYLDFISQICCGEYKRYCEAYQRFLARRRNPFVSP
jgi:hypothetical protein